MPDIAFGDLPVERRPGVPLSQDEKQAVIRRAFEYMSREAVMTDIAFGDLPVERDPSVPLSQDEKEALAECGSPFDIVGAQMDNGDYGPVWLLECRDEWDGPFVLSFRMGGRSETLYESLARTTADGNRVRGVYLHKRSFKKEEGGIEREIRYYVLAKSAQAKQQKLGE